MSAAVGKHVAQHACGRMQCSWRGRVCVYVRASAGVPRCATAGLVHGPQRPRMRSTHRHAHTHMYVHIYMQALASATCICAESHTANTRAHKPAHARSTSTPLGYAVDITATPWRDSSAQQKNLPDSVATAADSLASASHRSRAASRTLRVRRGQPCVRGCARVLMMEGRG